MHFIIYIISYYIIYIISKYITLCYLCFVKKAIKTELFSCCVSTSFYFQFWTGPSMCVFLRHYWFWCSLIIFRREAINPRNIWACLKDSLNGNMKLFPGNGTAVTQALRLPASFLILLREKLYSQTKPRLCRWF